MRLSRVLIAFILALAAAVALAQSVSSPKAGSSLRKDILEGFRPRVEKTLGVSVLFKVTTINVWKDWAFVRTQPLQKNGKPIDFAKTKLRKAYLQEKNDMWNNEFAGLLKKSGKSWKVVEYYYDYGDVAWAELPKQRHLPPELFGLTKDIG